MNKKKELMANLKRHRVDENVLSDSIVPTNKYVYVNDELTPTYRRLLWLAKTKAKENGWKYVWVKNGHIFARRNENSHQTIINNAADIELITKSQ